MKHYFTTIYRFMWEDLKLSGYTKEIFAVILGFFLPDRKPVPISFRVFRSITGASKSVIASSIIKLEKKGFVMASHNHGKRTTYSVSDGVMNQYDNSMKKCAEDNTDPKTGRPSNRSENRTSTSPEIGPHNINKYTSVQRKFLND